MKRIVLLVCGMLLLVANVAEARRSRTNGRTYSQPMYAAPVVYNTSPPQPVSVSVIPAATKTPAAQPAKAVTAAKSTPAVQPVKTVTVGYRPLPAEPTKAVTNSFSTATAQGVANIMASRGQVGHFGGNPGYEGCGMGPTPQAAYSICCYGNSGMATVDVGYAQGANGMWYCCRRYR
jgi:hypothetical protein